LSFGLTFRPFFGLVPSCSLGLAAAVRVRLRAELGALVPGPALSEETGVGAEAEAVALLDATGVAAVGGAFDPHAKRTNTKAPARFLIAGA
jgi:hypothetical protein